MWQDTRLTQKKKSVAPLCTNDKQAKKEIRVMSSFTVATNNIKYLRVTLTKQVKDVYDKNFKTLKKKLKNISENGIVHVLG